MKQTRVRDSLVLAGIVSACNLLEREVIEFGKARVSCDAQCTMGYLLGRVFFALIVKLQATRDSQEATGFYRPLIACDSDTA